MAHVADGRRLGTDTRRGNGLGQTVAAENGAAVAAVRLPGESGRGGSGRNFQRVEGALATGALLDVVRVLPTNLVRLLSLTLQLDLRQHSRNLNHQALTLTS